MPITDKNNLPGVYQTMVNQNPHKGHRERVRQKIIAGGLKNFQPHEILEFLLFHTVAQKDTNHMAHELISVFGSLENVFDATAEELMETGGLSLNSAILISSIRDISSYYKDTKDKRTIYNTGDKILALLKPFFKGHQKERLVVAFFDSNLKKRAVKEFGYGNENAFHINAKDIVREAITYNASYVAIAHNHPVSDSTPSKADINTTNILKNQLEFFDIKLLEHLIFGINGIFSFANNDTMSCFVSGKGEK